MTARQLTMDDALEASGDWAGLAFRAIEAMAATGARFQAFDLVECYGVPEPSSRNAWGAVFSAARAKGLIRRVGYAQSKRPTVAGSACAEWVGVAA